MTEDRITDTPRSDAVAFSVHASFADWPDEARDAIERYDVLCQTLERELSARRAAETDIALSCFVCGDPLSGAPCITHATIASVAVCFRCRDAAQAAKAGLSADQIHALAVVADLPESPMHGSPIFDGRAAETDMVPSEYANHKDKCGAMLPMPGQPHLLKWTCTCGLTALRERLVSESLI